MMHIAFCTDTNYIIPTGVAMISVCENNKEEIITFHLVITDEATDNIDIKEKVKPLLDIAAKYSKMANVYRMPESRISEFVCNGTVYVTTTAFSRIFLPEILDSSIKKVLYLDCDLICDGSLSDLWNITLPEDCPIGAIVDCNYASPRKHQIAEIPSTAKYINSGVLLMNLDCWRNNNYIDLSVNVALDKRFPMLDQDLLNHLFYENILYLPIKYNMQIATLLDGIDNCHIDMAYYEEIKEACINPIIIHYLTANKPWKLEKCPYKEKWQKYYELSIWKDSPFSEVTTRFDRSYIYEEIESSYWSDPTLFKTEAYSYMRFFKAAIKLKNKKKIVKLVSFLLDSFSSIIELIYAIKTNK